MLKRVMRSSVMGSTPGLRLLEEERDDAAARAHDVAVAHHREADVVRALEVVGRDEQLVARELGRAVEVDGRGGLVGRQRDDRATLPSIAASITFCAPEDVGLDGLERVVLAHRARA